MADYSYTESLLLLVVVWIVEVVAVVSIIGAAKTFLAPQKYTKNYSIRMIHLLTVNTYTWTFNLVWIKSFFFSSLATKPKLKNQVCSTLYQNIFSRGQRRCYFIL